MSSPLLALFIRSLREDARNRATYWARGGLGCFLLVVMALFLWPGRGIPAPGRVFFSTVIAFQIIAVTLMGLSYFASAIAEEKEEQTLGLLRMTGLSPLSILLGKSTSRLCGALLLLAAQFPFTIIAVTWGGISLWQIVVSYCSIGAFIFLLCNLALLGSVLSRGTVGAAVFCVVVIGLLLVAIPVLNGLQWMATTGLHWHLALDRVADGIWAATPMARLGQVLGTSFHGDAIGWQFLTNVALGGCSFLLAWAAFQRFCERELEGAGTASRAVASVAVKSLGIRLRRPRLPRAWQDALVWKDFYFLWGGHMGFIIRVVGYGGALFYDGWKLVTTGTAAGGIYGFGSLSQPIMPFVFSIEISVMASRMFRTELRDQTFSTLAMLPCSIRDIVHRKVRACLLAAVPGAICSLSIQVLFLFFSNQRLSSGTLSLPVEWTLSTVIGWLDEIVLVVLVASLSLYMKRGALPAGWLISVVGNWLVTVLCFVTLGTNFIFRRGDPAVILWGCSIAATIAGLLVSWALYLAGIQRLYALAGEE